MKPSIILAAASAIGILLLSSTFIASATASPNWQGRDNGEFDTCNSWGTCRLDSGGAYAEMLLSSSMTYSGSTYASLQYNPDQDISNSYQTTSNGQHDWFQSAILGENSCAYFTYQVYEIGGNEYADWYYNSDSCISVSGLFTYGSGVGALWYVKESTASTGYISDVCFDAKGGGSGGGDSGTQCVDPQTYNGPSGNWLWLRSNTCICGVSSDNASFTQGSGSNTGTLYYSGSQYLYGKPPPTDVSTLEDSNMHYGCFSGNGTSSLSQSFGSGKC